MFYVAVFFLALLFLFCWRPKEVVLVGAVIALCFVWVAMSVLKVLGPLSDKIEGFYAKIKAKFKS